MAKKKKDYDALAYFQKRFSEMDSERKNWQTERYTCDKQYEANVTQDNNGKVYINNPLEQDLIEMEVGRTSGRPTFDVIPDPYNPNPEQTEAAKYVLDSFLDREWFVREYRQRRIDKGIYGTAILYTWLRYENNKVMWRNEVELADQVGNGVFSNEELYDIDREQWYMTPMNIPIRHFWIDDNVFYQPDYRKAKDCIMAEALSEEVFKNRYEDNKHFDQEVVKNARPIGEDDAAYGIPSTRWLIVVYHYFNKITKDYYIVVNKTQLLFEGKMIYKHGDLPFVVCQHYPNNRCIYGFGICRKSRVSKAYLNNITQAIMDGSRMSSSKILGIWQSGQPVDWDLMAVPGGITMARFTNGVEQLQNIDTQVNITPMVNARQIVNDMVRTDTGIDMNAPFEAPADTLWQTEIIEENKSIRYKTIDEARDQALDDALEMTLSNIAQFAPILLKRVSKVYDDDGNVIEEIEQRPTIQVKNVSIKKKKGSQVITESYGDYGYLELKPETLSWDMTVRVVTPNTHNRVLTVIEKNKAKEMIMNYVELSQIYWPERIEEVMPLEEIMEKFKTAYGYDRKLVPLTKKREIEKRNEQLLKDMREFLSGNQPTNEQPIQQGMGWTNPQQIAGASNPVRPQGQRTNQNRDEAAFVDERGGAI